MIILVKRYTVYRYQIDIFFCEIIICWSTILAGWWNMIDIILSCQLVFLIRFFCQVLFFEGYLILIRIYHKFWLILEGPWRVTCICVALHIDIIFLFSYLFLVYTLLLFWYILAIWICLSYDSRKIKAFLLILWFHLIIILPILNSAIF